jgi:hypothetical protein
MLGTWVPGPSVGAPPDLVLPFRSVGHIQRGPEVARQGAVADDSPASVVKP